MPEKETLERARKDAAEGKASFYSGGRICPRRNRPRARRQTWRAVSQASNCYRAFQGPPRRCKATSAQRFGRFAQKSGAEITRAAKSKRRPSITRSRATESALRRESHQGASHSALSKQAKKAAASQETTKPQEGRTKSRSNPQSCLTADHGSYGSFLHDKFREISWRFYLQRNPRCYPSCRHYILGTRTFRMDSTRRDFFKVSAIGLAASSASALSLLLLELLAAPISVWLTSGKSRFSPANSLSWTSGKAAGAVIDLHPESKFQEVLGFGAAFTDASCYVLNQLEPSSRASLFHELFNPSEMGFEHGADLNRG